MATLIIVESPAKAKTIKGFLGRNYTVKASLGHVRDLPRSKFGIDLENNFEPRYITIRGKGPVLKELREAAKKADRILLATDPDREGEAIAWHLAEALNIQDDKCRIDFHEITKSQVRQSVKEPRPIAQPLVDAQQRGGFWTASWVTNSLPFCGPKSSRVSALDVFSLWP